MNSHFRYTVGSQPDYEDLVGDIYYDDQIVCVLTQEDGWDVMQLCLFPASDGGAWNFAVADFEEALAAVKKRMWELRRTG